MRNSGQHWSGQRFVKIKEGKMNELEVKQYVEVKNNNVFTTSRMVAERFNKKHKHVLDNIRKLKDLAGPYFRLSSYIDQTGKENIEYEMDESGFMLLAMRFTGPEALIIQVKFVEAFQKMKVFIKDTIIGLDLESKRLKSIPIAEPVFKTFKEVGLEFGLEKNQALLFANKATRRETGIDFQEILQIELKNERQDSLFTPTDLGSRLNISAKKFNIELERLGFQEKKNEKWVPTESGKKYSVLLDANKKHSDGTPIQQLKWYESVLEFFKQELSA